MGKRKLGLSGWDGMAARYGFESFDPFGGDGFSRSEFAEKSAAATRREEQAKRAFDSAREEFERDGKAGTLQLLGPGTHLTSACWGSFSKYVKASAGWTAKRREATEAEKRAAGEKRKGKCYWVDVTFKAAAAKKAKA